MTTYSTRPQGFAHGRLAWQPCAGSLHRRSSSSSGDHLFGRERRLPLNRNLLNLLRQSAPMLIVAVAMTFVITTGGIDLSVGSTVALVNALGRHPPAGRLPWPLPSSGLLCCGRGGRRLAGMVRRLSGHPGLHRDAGRAFRPARPCASMTQGFSIPISTDASVSSQIGRGWLLGIPFPAVVASSPCSGFALSSRRASAAMSLP